MSDNWKSDLLGNVATLQRGFDLPHRLRRSGKIPIVTSSGVEDTHNEAKVKAPGVVTGRYGTIGEVFYIDQDFWPHNTTLYVRNFHGNDPLFISYLLRTIDFHMHSGKTGVPGVNRNDLHEIIVSIPLSVTEQKAIAETLSDADALIEALEQLIAKKRQVKQGAMQELLMGKKRLTEFDKRQGYKQTDVGLIPEDWEVLPLRSACKLHNGRAYALHEWKKSGTPVIRLQNLTGGNEYYYSTLNLPDEKYCNLGDLLFMWSATFGPHIWTGERAIYHYHIWKVTPHSGRAISKYLFYRLFAIAEEKKTHAANGGTMLHVTKGEMESTLIALPLLTEQTAIAEILSDMDAEIAALEGKLSKARQVKQGMMQELLTGRVRLV